MKGIRIKIDDIVLKNHFDMVKLLVRMIAITKNLDLSETELYALTYFVINGYSKVSREALVTTKLLKNKSSVANLVYSFRKYGIIVKNSFGEELASDFDMDVKDVEGIKIEMLIKK